MHVSFFQVAAGIFPYEAGNDVQGEQLAVVGMTAEIQAAPEEATSSARRAGDP